MSINAKNKSTRVYSTYLAASRIIFFPTQKNKVQTLLPCFFTLSKKNIIVNQKSDAYIL